MAITVFVIAINLLILAVPVVMLTVGWSRLVILLTASEEVPFSVVGERSP
jgi:hypothetical protein